MQQLQRPPESPVSQLQVDRGNDVRLGALQLADGHLGLPHLVREAGFGGVEETGSDAQLTGRYRPTHQQTVNEIRLRPFTGTFAAGRISICERDANATPSAAGSRLAGRGPAAWPAHRRPAPDRRSEARLHLPLSRRGRRPWCAWRALAGTGRGGTELPPP